MRTTQLNVEGLMSIVGRYIASSGMEDTIYTYKYIKGIELVNKNNRMLVPNSKQQSVLD